MSDIEFSQENSLGIITLSRAKALNALSLSMLSAMYSKLKDWENDNSIKAVLVRSSSEKAFCAGGDVRSLYEQGIERKGSQLDFFKTEYRLNHYIYSYPKPYISFMNGVTMGGGVGISIHGSHPVATENFLFAMPETAIGFVPDIGSSFLLARMPHKFGMYLGLTGERVKVFDAKALKLVNYTVPAKNIDDLLTSLISADLSINAHQSVSEIIGRYNRELGEPVIADLHQDVEALFNYQTLEEVVDYLHRRDSSFTNHALKLLANKSPLSLRVTFAQLQKVVGLSLAKCLEMDYCLVANFMYSHDFYEGVRALLVDKDKSPKWEYKNIQDINESVIASYFDCKHGKLHLAP